MVCSHHSHVMVSTLWFVRMFDIVSLFGLYFNGFQVMIIIQASKKADFIVDLTWWDSLRLTPVTLVGESLSEPHHRRSTVKSVFLLA